MTHYLLLAKLPAWRYDMNGLNWIFDCLMGRDQRVKSNLFLAHTQIFLKASTRINFEVTINQDESDLVNYADDNTQHACSENIDMNLEKMQEVENTLSEWFSTNFLKTNADKCHLI